VGFLLAITPIVGFLVAGLLLRRMAGWRRFGTWLLLGSPLTLALTVLFFATFDPEAAGAGVGVAGLIQRALIVEIHAWYAALGWLAFRNSRMECYPECASPRRQDRGRTPQLVSVGRRTAG
jgi:hypothetical protein